MRQTNLQKSILTFYPRPPNQNVPLTLPCVDSGQSKSLFLVDKSTGLSSAPDKVCDTCAVSVAESGSSLLVADWTDTVTSPVDGVGTSSLLVQTKSAELVTSFSRD